ncbi:TAP-like protein [Kribbella pratensis]|uniref:TAP-like protein n=1 Tax=Kribbella pratensis TaxID=2512112 RepID=A0ABY2FLN7_9ACTN|nr:alpha/beta hydrolase [Kribbella pratensis]TDW93704.1 TAP-like protein [Kribbella pratensis]
MRGLGAVAALLAVLTPPTPAALPAEDCLVQVPAGARCGRLEVPENRDAPATRTITIPYVVVPAREAAAKKPPLVFMGGGPGSGTIQLAYFFAGLAPDRDVVLLEQRGGDRATPDLDCEEADKRFADMFTRTEDPYAEANTVAAAMRTCLDDFRRSGGDPRGYTARAAALDLRDLRVALGYPHWSLYGLSWSTGVMAQLATLDPAGVDAVVLDSFSPPSVDFAQNGYDGLRTSLGPDAYADLIKAAAQLDAHPQAVPGHNPVTNESRTYRLTGDDLVTLVHSAAYEVDLLPILPLLLHQLAEGKYGTLNTLVAVGIGELVSHNLGQYWLMQCQDEVPYRTAGARHARPVIAWLAADDVVCGQLGLLRSPAATREPVHFTQPTLVLAGAQDPITPAQTAQSASAGLPHRQFVEFAGIGHAVVLSSRCGRTVVTAWLDQPGRSLEQCQHEPPYQVVRPTDLHLTSRLAATAAGATDGRYLPIVPAALFVLLVVGWILGWIVHAIVRRRVRLWNVLPPVLGLLFLGSFGALLWSEYDVLPARLLLGVPHLAPWTGVLLLAALPWWVKARSWWSAGVGVIWLTGLAWFTVVVVLPS